MFALVFPHISTTLKEWGSLRDFNRQDIAFLLEEKQKYVPWFRDVCQGRPSIIYAAKLPTDEKGLVEVKVLYKHWSDTTRDAFFNFAGKPPEELLDRTFLVPLQPKFSERIGCYISPVIQSQLSYFDFIKPEEF